MDVALTVQDAKELQARELKLVHHKLQALPSDLGQLAHLTKLDASDNPIKDITKCFLPLSLKELNLTGCQLIAVPQCLTSLTNLQHLQLSANQIYNMDAVFHIPYLIHAGLAFNHVSSLHTSSQRHSLVAGAHPKAPCSLTGGQHSNRSSLITSSATAAQKSVDSLNRRTSTPPASPGSKSGKASTNSNHNSPKVSTAGYKDTSAVSTHQQPCSKCRSSVMSLDLSHNDIIDLPAVLQQLQQLSQLKSLSLKGNPISLLPCYREAVLQQLPQLMYFDGQKLDGIVTTSNSRPSSSAASRHRPGSSRRPGSRPTSCKSTNSLTITDKDQQQQQQQQSLTGAFADLLAPPDQVTVPLLLQLNTLQIVESAAKVFAGLLELSMEKQQEVLQQHVSQQQQQGADEGAGGPANSSHGGKETGVNPATSAVTAATATAGADGGGGGGGHASDLGRAEGSLAVDVSTSPAEIPVAALKPIIYHLQTIAPDGSEMCSTPLIIQPPAVAPDPAAIAAAEAAAAITATSAASPKKGKGSKAPKQPDKPAAAAAAAKSKASAKAVKGRSSADEGTGAAAAASQLADGCLKVMLQLPASVVGRDWLRQGFTVKLMRTHQQPETVEQQSAAAPQSATVTNTAITKNGRPNSGKGSSKPVTGAAGAMQGGSAASTSSISWQYSTQQQLLGTAKISAANLLEGDVQHEHLISEGTAEFMPEPSLYDTATGTLMLLKEAKAKLQPVGSCKYKLVLHHEKDCSVE